ncbi:MAG TPA: LysM peptidoglycan-binding domain-containing protein, partial [Luteimonas sp.]|nr:LysM peptidoglycan-binding domain-containing protein [Luteimonas sp.]
TASGLDAARLARLNPAFLDGRVTEPGLRVLAPAANTPSARAPDVSAAVPSGAPVAATPAPSGAPAPVAGPATRPAPSSAAVVTPVAAAVAGMAPAAAPVAPADPAKPAVAAVAARADTRMHVVKRGDSAWTIARTYRISLAQLLARNALDADATLHPGMQLAIGTSAAEPAMSN